MEKKYFSCINLAKLHINKFNKLISNISYEHKGILYSEMFFLFLNSSNINPNRIIESGTARGQSTLILCKLFPKSQILSIEHDKKSNDVPIALKRLSKQKNVSLHYGDSRILFPKILKGGSNDIVLIDGPKGYKAIRLAIKALKYKNVKKIFIHDTSFDTKERLFLEKYLPETIYSDYPKLAKITHYLDSIKKVEIDKRFKYRENKEYGYSLACIDNKSNKNYQYLIPLSRAIQFIERIEEKIKKLIRF